MASPKQDAEINMSKTQIKKLNSEMKKEARLRIHEANIDWLNKEWQGPDWFPTGLLRPFKPCRSVVRGLRNITEEAMIQNIPLSSLWEPGGCLRSVVDQDLAIRKAGRSAKHRHPHSGRLTKKMVNHARKKMSSLTAEMGNDCSSSSGSTIGDDSEVEAPEKSNTVLRLSSSAFDSSAKQRLPSPLHDTVVSTKDELRDPPKAALSSLKKTFDARAVRALKLENAKKVVRTCKDRLDKAQVNHEAALKSNPIDDWHLEVVWDMFERSDAHEREIQ